MAVESIQRSVDTRALELAQKAVTLIEQHERECSLERSHLATTLGEIKTTINTLFGILWSVAGVSILTLIVALGTVVFFMITGHKP